MRFCHRPIAVTAVLITMLTLLAVSACSGDSASRGQQATTGAAPPGGRAVTIEGVGGAVPGALYGGGSSRGIIVIGEAVERGEWNAAATELAQLGYAVLVYNGSAGDDTTTARAAAELLRRRGAEKVIFLGSGSGAAEALAAAREGAAGVVLLSPTVQLDSLPRAGMPSVPLLVIASLTDPENSALARRIYDAGAEPRFLALYPNRATGPALLRDADAGEVKDVLLDFLRTAFSPQSA